MNASGANEVIDFEKGISNCIGDNAFYKKLLSMFLLDGCYQRSFYAFSQKDYDALFRSLHELKGASGNTALVMLFSAVAPLVELLRSGSHDDIEIGRMFADVSEAYELTCSKILEYLK